MEVMAPGSELMDAMDFQVSVIHSASADLLRAVAAFDQGKCWERDGATSMSSWLASRYGLAWGSAREWVRVAMA